MNLLDSVLCTSEAQEYSSNFKKFSIDAFTLKLLNDEDLKILGIKEEAKRASLLQHAANLQIPAEKHIDITIDHKYMQMVLAQMSVQLTKHLAALSIAVNREDTIICNVKLFPAANCLKHCVMSFDEKLNEFEEKMTTKQKKKHKLKNVVIPAVIITVAGLMVYKMSVWPKLLT